MASPAGIARSLTTRMNRKQSVTNDSGTGSSIGAGLSRAFSMKKPERPAPRPDISLPVELISATNLLAFNAPDIPASAKHNTASPSNPRPLNAVQSTVSLRSEGSVPGLSSATSTATFNFSAVSTPVDEISEPRMPGLTMSMDGSEAPPSPRSHKSFGSAKARSPTNEAANAPYAPAVPKRAPSHTKKTHQVLARQRSVSRMRSETISTSADSTPALMSDTGSRTSSTASSRHVSSHSTVSAKEQLLGRESSDAMSSLRTLAPIDASHPFGAELAKLTEVAEEFSPRRAKAEDVPMARSRSNESRSSNKASTPVQQHARTPSAPKFAAGPIKTPRKVRPMIEPTVWDEEQEFLSKHGLRMFSAEEYMAEIGSPYMASFSSSVY